MGVLKRKQENEAISFKLPSTLKREIEALAPAGGGGGLRPRRNDHGGAVAAVQADEGRARTGGAGDAQA